MAYKATLLLDSIAPSGCRLTTFELTYPRFVHSEFMTHRMFSRNSASSRAIPIDKMIERVINDPVLPVWWGKNQSGMQAEAEIDGYDRVACESLIIELRDRAIQHVKGLQHYNLHKQIANRYLEPWMWITVICTATEFNNFFHLRTDKAAQPEIRKIADMMCEIYHGHQPTFVPYGQWHMPLTQEGDTQALAALPYDKISEYLGPNSNGSNGAREVSVARCARVSYLTHDGRRDVLEDLKLFARLRTSGHWSPFEHVAESLGTPTEWGNFRGWKQFRKLFSEENVKKFDHTKWHSERTSSV